MASIRSPSTVPPARSIGCYCEEYSPESELTAERARAPLQCLKLNCSALKGAGLSALATPLPHERLALSPLARPIQPLAPVSSAQALRSQQRPDHSIPHNRFLWPLEANGH